MICYVYGVSRLTDDIHFLVGYKPNKAGQYVWATFPIVLYVSTTYTIKLVPQVFNTGLLTYIKN